jgi:hypothetical protein
MRSLVGCETSFAIEVAMNDELILDSKTARKST